MAARGKLSEAEAEVMAHLWELSEAGLAALIEAINARRDEPVTRTTVQVWLGRLETKGWIGHRAGEGRGHIFFPRVEKAAGQAELARALQDRVFGGSAAQLMACLVREKLPASELTELRRLLDEAEATVPRPRRKS